MHPPYRVYIYLVLLYGMLVHTLGGEGIYIGCFKDSPSARDLPRNTEHLASMTVESCVRRCKQIYFRYAGLQNGLSCFCGSSYGSYGPSTCSLRCSGNSSQECGDTEANSVFETGQKVPGPVGQLTQVQNSEGSLQVQWAIPEAPNGVVTGYRVAATPIQSYSNFHSSLVPLEWSFSNESLRGDLVGVHPGTRYNITVYAISKDGLGIGTSQAFWSQIGEPETPKAPEVVRVEDGKIVVHLTPVTPQNGPITSYRVVVIDERIPSHFLETNLKSWKEAEEEGNTYYIAAEFQPENLPKEFVVGDGLTYGGFENPKLPPDHDFHVTLQVVSSQDGITKTAYARVSHDQHRNKGVVYLGPPPKIREEVVGDDPVVILGLSVAIGVFGFLLLLSVIIYIGLRYHFGKKRKRQNSENQELTVQGPMVDVEENGYIHNGLVLGDEGPVDYYDRLRAQVTTIPRLHLQLEEGQPLGQGHYGEVMRGTVQQRGFPVPATIHVVSDSSMSEHDKKNMLHDLDVLIRVGFHNNILTLLGISEEPDHLYLVTEYHPASLKDLLLESRALEHFPAYSDTHSRFSTLQESQLLEAVVGVAQGMDFLASIKVVHQNLCARNVVMADGVVPKVTGFGLAQYRKIGANVFDYSRWMAQEVFRSRLKTSSKSDVWSFGCLLWEIACLGGTPYSDIKTKDVPMRVMRGARLPQLPYVGDDLYQLMLQCWQIDLDERPSFSELASVLENLCMDSLVHLNFGMYPGFQYEKYDPELETF